MSLLMDALRKAEEAKKKATQEGQSEEPVQISVADEQQLDAAPEKAQTDSSPNASTPEPELRMADMEELPPRAPVQNINIDTDLADEEDYVLPSSVGTPAETETEIELENGTDTAADQKATSPGIGAVSIETKEPEPEPEPEVEITWEASPIVEELESVAEASIAPPESKPFAFDNLEDQDNRSQDSEEGAALEAPVEASLEAPLEREVKPTSRPLIVAKVAEKSRGMGAQRGQTQGKGKNEPERRTARNVFSAKKSRLSAQNFKIAAGGALVLVVFIFATYFYISLNQESTFNLPEGSYVASEFVDDGINSQIGDDLSANDLSTSIVVSEDIPATNITQLLTSDATVSQERAATAISDVAEETLEELALTVDIAEVVVEPATTQVEVVAESSQGAANIQPEAIAPPRDTVATTRSAVPAVIEPGFTQEPVQTGIVNSAQITPDAEPTNLISFRRQASVKEVDPNVSRAYTAYQQGSIDQAQVLYRQTLARDPLQRDALVGLATIAARKGNSAEALDLYSKLLARNPGDPIARAGLMELLPTGSPSQQEAELRRLLNEHPNVATISYAYGNFLASSQRWSEAQQAYFRALQLAKADAVAGGLVNPDYAFNLAVSLEHLNQPEPAENYYREALQLAANHPAGFDAASVRSRLENMARSGSND